MQVELVWAELTQSGNIETGSGAIHQRIRQQAELLVAGLVGRKVLFYAQKMEGVCLRAWVESESHSIHLDVQVGERIVKTTLLDHGETGGIDLWLKRGGGAAPVAPRGDDPIRANDIK